MYYKMNKYNLIAYVFVIFISSCGIDKDYVSSQKIDGGVMILKKAHFHDKNNAEKNKVGSSYILNKQYVEAEKTFREIIEESPNEYTAHHGLGTALYYQKKYNQSKVSYVKAIEANREFADPYIGLGAVEMAKNNYHGAIKAYTKAINVNANMIDAYYARGIAYTRLGAYESAVLDFNITIKKSPKSNIADSARKNIKIVQGYKKSEI